MGAAACLRGTAGGVVGAPVHGVRARDQLLGAAPLRLGRALIERRSGGIELGLLVVEQRLVFVTTALCVIEHVL